MPFTEIEERVDASHFDKPGSARLLMRKSGKCTLILGIKQKLSEQIKLKDGDEVGIAIGSGSDEGKLRIIPKAKKKVAKTKKQPGGSISFDLGHIASFPNVASGKTPVDVVFFPGSEEIEFTMPGAEFWEVADAAEETNEPAAPKGSKQADEVVLERGGIAILANPPRVRFAGETCAISAEQGRILAVLIPALGKGWMTALEITKRIHGHLGANGSRQELVVDQLKALQTILAPIKVNVRRSAHGYDLDVQG
jgi:hypothetical protein